MEKREGKRKRGLIISFVILCLILGAISLTVRYLNEYMPSRINPEDYNDDQKHINIEENDSGVFIDSPGGSEMLVFYPGAKVEPSAYVPLLSRLAQEGVDSYIVKMPYNLAVLNSDAFSEVKEKFPDYQNWYIAGHSLGGAMAADYAAKNPSGIDGLILLGAYSTKDLNGLNIPVLSIYGENDQVLNYEKYEADRGNLPDGETTETVISGGNHAGFGEYGPQKGDGQASISSDEQQRLSAEEILDFIGSNKEEE